MTNNWSFSDLKNFMGFMIPSCTERRNFVIFNLYFFFNLQKKKILPIFYNFCAVFGAFFGASKFVIYQCRVSLVTNRMIGCHDLKLKPAKLWSKINFLSPKNIWVKTLQIPLKRFQFSKNSYWDFSSIYFPTIFSSKIFSHKVSRHINKMILLEQML